MKRDVPTLLFTRPHTSSSLLGDFISSIQGLSFCWVIILSGFFSSILLVGCASGPTLQTQKYAKLSQNKVYEYEFPKVWKGIEEAMRRYRITDRNPHDLSPLELKKTTHRTLKTDWIYAQSKDKYLEYTVNGTPRKIYPQTRYQLTLDAQQVLGGVSVQVQVREEIEQLTSQGESKGYQNSGEADPAIASDLLDRISLTILSLPNTD